MDKVGQAAAATSGATGPAILKALEDLLVTLRKSSKDLAFYPPGHPLLNRSMERAAEQLCAVVATRTSLSLSVSRTSFTFEGQIVGKENRQLATMATELFVRRIQKLFFAPEIGPEELAGFLRVITSDPKQLVQQGGAAKVLAAHGVGRIQVNEFDFRRVGTAADAAGRDSGTAGTAAEPTAGEVETVPQGALGTLATGETTSPGLGARAMAGGQAEQGKVTPESLLAALGPPQEQTVETLIQRLEKEAASGDAAEYEKAASRLEQAIGHAIHDDWLQDVLAILRVFLRHRRAENLKLAVRERASGAVETVSRGNTVAYLIQHLRTVEGQPARDLSAVLVGLGARVIAPLLGRLIAEDREEARERLAATLARIQEVAEPDLTQALQALGRDQASHLAPILGEVGGEAGASLLSCLYRHGDAGVRVETVRELGRYEELTAQRQLVQALRDPAPAVFEAAANVAGDTKLKLATPALGRLAGRQILRGKPFVRRKKAIAALGSMGDPGTIPLLRQVLYTRTWFQRQAGDELRQAAAMALSAMDYAEAREVVEDGARSRRRDVRRACAAALRAMPAHP